MHPQQAKSRIAMYAGKAAMFAVAGVGLISVVAVEAIVKRGFDESAQASLGPLEKRIDDLQDRALKGKLTQQESALKANLENLRIEMLSSLAEHWDDRRSWLTRRPESEDGVHPGRLQPYSPRRRGPDLSNAESDQMRTPRLT